jgi:hypothetical protein
MKQGIYIMTSIRTLCKGLQVRALMWLFQVQIDGDTLAFEMGAQSGWACC